jgi:hypothetical protein
MKSFFALASFAFLTSLASCFGTTTSQVFARYPNPYFVESGTWVGDGVQMALDAGFKKVRSIELSPIYFARSSKRFNGNPAVQLYQGNSGEMLYEVIKDIQVPITFWLDGHYSGGDTARGAKKTPILEELDQIKRHPIKTHTILIDDMRCCNGDWFDFISKEQIIKKVLEINPNYQITYDAGCTPTDVLVARPPEKIKSVRR